VLLSVLLIGQGVLFNQAAEQWQCLNPNGNQIEICNLLIWIVTFLAVCSRICYFSLWTAVLLFWLSVIRMLRNANQSTDNVSIGGAGRCTRIAAVASVVVVSLCLLVSLALSYVEDKNERMVSIAWTLDERLWQNGFYLIHSIAWSLLSISSSAIAWKLYRICLLAFGGYRAVCRTKRVSVFMVVSVLLWGGTVSIVFMHLARTETMRCSAGESGSDFDWTSLLFYYQMWWWSSHVVGTFIPILLFSVTVMATRPKAFLKPDTPGPYREALLDNAETPMEGRLTADRDTTMEGGGSLSEDWSESVSEEGGSLMSSLRSKSEAPASSSNRSGTPDLARLHSSERHYTAPAPSAIDWADLLD
jgi:hypothetical protein